MDLLKIKHIHIPICPVKGSIAKGKIEWIRGEWLIVKQHKTTTCLSVGADRTAKDALLPIHFSVDEGTDQSFAAEKPVTLC